MSEQVLDKGITTSEQARQQQQVSSNSNSTSSSPSNSISLIKLDELSSFGATKQSRLPTLIKLNTEFEENSARQANSMPEFSAEQLEKSKMDNNNKRQQVSLPAQLGTEPDQSVLPDKENQSLQVEPVNKMTSAEDFQMVDMVSNEEGAFGPSLPQPFGSADKQQAAALASNQQINVQQPSYLAGDSLIEMIINLRNENQNLVKALETNNEYVKERLSEFKRFNEEAKKREAQFALEKIEHEHQVRKLQRQNTVLSERLKSMEAKLKDLKLEVSDSLAAAHSSKASSLRDETAKDKLYPDLGEPSSINFNNVPDSNTITMQMDATSGELLDSCHQSPTAPPMETDQPRTGDLGEQTEAMKVADMSNEELRKRFDAPNKDATTDFYALDDPMKQCDRLEQQLNDIGKRDYEICLLQQQLNIYRQDFRLERMANLEAKIQIEKLKNDIDKLCFERLQEKSKLIGDQSASTSGANNADRHSYLSRGVQNRLSGGAATAADAVINKLGQHLSKKAVRTAAKAAKYASKQAYREEKAAATAAAAAAAALATSSSLSGGQQGDLNDTSQQQYSHHNRRHHYHNHLNQHHGHHSRARGIRSEVVTDLLSTANKAMLTGYKMASTHVNLALDKLSAFEQAQAANLAQNKPATGADKAPGNATGAQPSLD